MNPWLFFGLLIAALLIVEFVPVKTGEARSGSEAVEPRLSRSRLRLVHATWYLVLLAATLGWWLGYGFASFVLGCLFAGAAVIALLCVASWIPTKSK